MITDHPFLEKPGAPTRCRACMFAAKAHEVVPDPLPPVRQESFRQRAARELMAAMRRTA